MEKKTFFFLVNYLLRNKRVYMYIREFLLAWLHGLCGFHYMDFHYE